MGLRKGEVFVFYAGALTPPTEKSEEVGEGGLLRNLLQHLGTGDREGTLRTLLRNHFSRSVGALPWLKACRVLLRHGDDGQRRC